MKGQRLFMLLGLFFAVGLALVVLAPDVATAQEVCNDGIDNDKDTLIDCKDPDCATDPVCKTPPPPKVTADCSPGFYKKHPNTWDDGICCMGDALTAGTDCNRILLFLSAELGATEEQRATAKAFLDACFVTAEASPCEDDD
jgi:hypothetical protein